MNQNDDDSVMTALQVLSATGQYILGADVRNGSAQRTGGYSAVDWRVLAGPDVHVLGDEWLEVVGSCRNVSA
ncbi:MAG: hypothetical protein V4610_04295 [Pseudomonadota bacterium]